MGWPKYFARLQENGTRQSIGITDAISEGSHNELRKYIVMDGALEYSAPEQYAIKMQALHLAQQVFADVARNLRMEEGVEFLALYGKRESLEPVEGSYNNRQRSAWRGKKV